MSAGAAGLALAIAIVGLAVDRLIASGPSAHGGTTADAVLHNFSADLLRGHDGLPPSPAFPLKYGPFNTAIDVDGNAIDAHEAHLAYFEGQYWMYGREWGCGTMSFGHLRDESARNDKPECGIVSLSSPDLVHWRVVDRDYIPMLDGEQVGDQKPQVVWSATLHRYLMWFVGPRGYYVAESRSPGGPWGNVFKPAGKYLSHDLNIMVEPDGSAYVASDVLAGFEGRPGMSPPWWDVWIQKLNPDLTGTTGEAVRVMSHVSFEGIGFFEHGGYWYLLGSHTCGNCPSSDISYLMARAPLGPWTNGDGSISSPLHPTELSDDGCLGQDKGANALPSKSGPIIIEGIMQYRSSPLDKVGGAGMVHGDNNQAIANTYWWPVRFDRDHHIEPLVCQASVRVPLAHSVRASVAPVPPLDTAPGSPHQLDCRITSTGALQQRWTVPANTRLRELQIPVFQRTTNLGPEEQDAIMNAGLNIRFDLPTGASVTAAFPPESISWSARSVALKLPTALRSSGAVTLTLTTTATNGCYGAIIGAATSALRSGVYSAVENGVRDEADGAQMVLSTITGK
jgi:hypothetical protein